MPIKDDDLVWRLGKRTPGEDYKIFTTHHVEAEHPLTHEIKRFALLEATDWVNIIALTRDDRVVLVRQYRPGIDRVCIEIPGGMVDPGEDAKTAAARELVEETGYTSRSWRLLGTVAPNPAIQNNRLYTYLALDAEQTEAPTPEGGEVLALETASLEEVQQLLRSGRIEHALVVTAFAHLALELTTLRRP